MTYITDQERYKFLTHAQYLKDRGYFLDGDIFQIADTLEKAYLEKLERDVITDQSIDYNDEIVSIECVGELETIDISVSGDNLFLCNGILTKNSMGLVHTLDLYLAQIAPEDLQELNQMMFKQLKNRYNDPNYYKRFVVGFDRPKMTFYDLETSAQENIIKNSSGKLKKEDDKPVFDSSKFGSRMRERKDFGDFNFGEG